MSSRMHGGSSDVWAGLAAAAVALPQSVAFGVALLAPLGFDAAKGALAGLIAAAALSLVSGLLGGTSGLISAPCGPIFVLLAGTLSAVAASGTSGPDLLAVLMAILLAAGTLQITIGLSGGGQLIKYIPFPVMAGFMTGAAILMIKSQIKPLTGGSLQSLQAAWGWLPPAVAVVTYGVMELAPRYFAKVPPTVAGLIGGTIVFNLAIRLGPGTFPASWVIGTLPGPEAIHVSLSAAAFKTLPWSSILPAAMALSVLAALDTLMNSVIADVETGDRHNARRELLSQGIGHLLSGLLGGTGGSGTTAATVVSVKTGGRRWAAAITGVTFVLLLLFFGPVGQWLAISVLAAIIIRAAMHMIVWDMFSSWLKRPQNRPDAGVAILVTGVTVVYDLMAAVAVGVALAIVFFIRTQIRAPVIHRRSTGKQRRSVRSRTKEERKLLDEYGDRIVFYELRGNLFFATADRLFGELLPDLDRPAWVILHLRRVQQIDLTGLKLLHQIAMRLRNNGGQLVFCDVYEGMGLWTDISRAVRSVGGHGDEVKTLTFVTSDEALEYAENALLSVLGQPPIANTERVPLTETDLGEELAADELAAFERVLRRRSVDGGGKLFSAGETGDDMYFVVEGEIDIRLPTDALHYKRLAKYGPGTLFGEIAFLDPGPRTADAVAVLPSELLVLDRDSFRQLAKDRPDAAIALLMALGRREGHSLRWADRELTRLSQW